MAGPVVAAAVVLSPEARPSWLTEVRDSKQMSPGRREFVAAEILRDAVAVGVGVISPREIDLLGIVTATRSAMRAALDNLHCLPEWLLIDAMDLRDVRIPQRSIIKGDCRCLSIAAASIVAKVHRDRLMIEYDRLYPGYGFAQHKGYGTASHLARLARLGRCPIHRMSFAPLSSEQKADV